jgi:hypothetical protein
MIFHVWIQRSGRDWDVQIVGIVVYHDADPPRAVNSRGLQDGVPFRISLNEHDFIFQELTVEPLVGFDEDKGISRLFN